MWPSRPSGVDTHGAFAERRLVAYVLAVAALEQAPPSPPLRPDRIPRWPVPPRSGLLGNRHVIGRRRTTAIHDGRRPPQREHSFGMALLLEQLLARVEEVELGDEARRGDAVSARSTTGSTPSRAPPCGRPPRAGSRRGRRSPPGAIMASRTMRVRSSLAVEHGRPRQDPDAARRRSSTTGYSRCRRSGDPSGRAA